MVAFNNLLENCGADKYNIGHVAGPDFKGHSLDEYEEALRQAEFTVTRSSLEGVSLLYFIKEKRDVQSVGTQGPDERLPRTIKIARQGVSSTPGKRAKGRAKRNVR